MPAGMSVRECLIRLGDPLPGYDWAIAVDGMLLPDNVDCTHCRPAASLVVCARPQGGDGKNPLATVAMIAVLIVATVATYGVGAFVATGAWAWGAGTYAGVGAGMASAVAGAAAGISVAVAGNLLVSTLLPPSLDMTGGQADFSKSPTYGWEIDRNTDREDTPWPVLFGTHRICPPILAKYIEVVGDRQYFNLLFAVADHPIDTIDENSIELNGNPVVKGQDGVTWEIRLGTLDQPVIQYFNDTRVVKGVGVKLSEDWTTAQTDGNAVEGFGVAVSLPRGLYHITDRGEISDLSLKLDIEYRRSPDGNWVRLQGCNMADMPMTAPRWSAGYWLYTDVIPQWFEVLAGSDDPDDHRDGDVYYKPAPEINWDYYYEVEYDRTAYTWRWLDVTIVKVPGEVTTDYFEIYAAQTGPLRRIFYMDRLPAGAWEIRCRLHEALPTPAGRYTGDCWFDYIEEIIYDDFEYPGTALFALRALATDKLSGGMPKLSLIASRSTVPVWTGSEYEQRPADLSAWQAWDFLHNGDYGGGVEHGRLPLQSFDAWAAYCETKSYRSNIYFDGIMSMRKALDVIGAVGEGAVAQMGGKYVCYTDGEVDYPVQSFMFTDANILRDSYSETYLSADERANAVAVTFWDAANGYKRTTVEILAPDFDTTTREIKRSQLSLPGCTSRAEAIKHGVRALNRNRFLTMAASWEVGFDAIGCMPWDPVVPPLGLGGRCVSYAAETGALVIDRTVVLQPGRIYKCRIKYADDTVAEATVQDVAQETVTDTLSIVGGLDPAPQLHDLYLFYEQGEEVKLMRVLSITRADEMTRRITAVEYHPAACDDTGDVPWSVPLPDPHRVDRLRAEETWKGGAETCVCLSWTGFAVLWNIWLRRPQTTAAWTWRGEVTCPAMEIGGLDYGTEYEFCVSHTLNPADGNIVSLTLTGKTTPPGNVGAVTAVPFEDKVAFSWSKVPDFDLAGYRVRTGVHWQAEALYFAIDLFVVPMDGTQRRYRCITPGISGATEPAWPETGTVGDGSVLWEEASADWAWQTTATPGHTHELTAAEQAHQGKGNLTLRLWVEAVDAFDNVSLNAATAAGICLNHKPYISVGVTTVEGKFTGLSAAIAKLPSGGGRIAIKNGIYDLSGSLSLPDKNLDIYGESKRGVVLRTADGYSAFSFVYINSRIGLSNFTIESQSNLYKSDIFSITNTPVELFLEDIDVYLQGGGYYAASGDVGVYSSGHKKLSARRCFFFGGKSAVMVLPASQPSVYPEVILADCIMDGNSYEAVSLRYSIADCRNNRLTNQAVKGFSINTCDRSELNGNTIISRTDECTEFTGIDIEWFGTHVENNTIIVKHGSNNSAVGISCCYWHLYPMHHVVGNRIAIELGSTFALKGIVCQAFAERNLSNNIINLKNTVGTVVGITLDAILTNYSDKNGISGNQVRLSDVGGYGRGIHLTSGARYNTGSANVISGASTNILDQGTNNNVNSEPGDINGGDWS
jgi:hypothetical protein